MTKNKRTGPLDGVTVVDLTRVLAGPYCTMVLHDMGARVIKVEQPGGGDIARGIGPFVDERSAYFTSLNRGKQSIALDLKDADDRVIFEALLEKADVLVENYRGGTMEKIGYGWDTLHDRYPRLIYAATSGFGHSGPYKTRAAYDMVVQGMGGIMSLTGHPNSEPTRVGSSVGDITAGLFTAIAVNGALYDREQTCKGIKLDVAMLDCQVAILENAIARYFATGQIPGPIGARHPSITPFEAYRTSDGYVIIAVGTNDMFRLAAEVLGRPEIADDPRFETNELRTQNHEAVKVELELALVTKTSQHWLAVLDAARIPCGPLNNVEQVLNEPQVAARNMVVEAPNGSGKTLKMAGNPIKTSAYDDPPTRGVTPELDGDRVQILKELGL
jgi:CoA:oxalate CoA-transferase